MQMVTPPAISSTLAVPFDVNLNTLQALLDDNIPQDLWTIDEPDATCAQPQHVKLLGARIPITPKMHCHITGVARRGTIRLHGAGRVIVADLPILAHVEVAHVGGLVSAHADAQAMAHARITLDISRQWRPSGTVSLHYDWTSPPTVDILGQHITFTRKADAKLKPLIARLSRKLPQKLAEMRMRDQIDELWRRGFAVVQLNGNHPPVWLRAVPQSLSYDGYAIVGNTLRLNLGLVALTQAVVGHRPDDPRATPLPDMSPVPVRQGNVRLFVPVIADYAELVPVITRALTKRSARPFVLPGLGTVYARFSHIEVYGASKGRIAVGADIQAIDQDGRIPPTHARIWFAGVPHNADGSQLVHFSDLSVAGDADNAGGNMALAIANSPAFSDTIADALTQNFTHDYAKLQGKIQKAITQRSFGALRLDARLVATRNEALQPYANGLYMPVWLSGTASLAYVPHGRP